MISKWIFPCSCFPSNAVVFRRRNKHDPLSRKRGDNTYTIIVNGQDLAFQTERKRETHLEKETNNDLNILSSCISSKLAYCSQS